MHPGLTRTSEGVEIAVFSAHAEALWFCVFGDDGLTETHRLPLTKSADGWWTGIWAEAPESFLYGLRADGPYAPEQGHRFNVNKLLLDPYAKRVEGVLQQVSAVFGFEDRETGAGFNTEDSAPFVPKARFAPASTPPQWQRPSTRWRDTLVYEAHLKGLTQLMPGVPEDARGRFSALTTEPVLDHLEGLGVTALELLPLADFEDERHLGPLGLTNYFGYNPLGFFVPSRRYTQADPVAELQAGVAALHARGIEAVVDVVFNHTAESDHLGPTLSYRGLDNASYYLLDAANPFFYQNPAGTGNALKTAHPVVSRLVLDALAYWHQQLGFDGFRFDLASTLARDEDGVMQNPVQSLPETIAEDPRLSSAKLIAEPWDIGFDGYQLGRFGDRWVQWNDRFRDGARRLWHPGLADGALQGFADLFLGSAQTVERPLQSLNFITAHDGFTLADLTAYDHKHNEANGENNRDGHGHNLSWNHGVEGPTDDGRILADRSRTRRALLSTLLLSQGVAMLWMGDELGNSQQGNNNAYCQDGPLSWIDWDRADERLLGFTKEATALVADLPALRQARHLHDESRVRWLRADGQAMNPGDWEDPLLRSLLVWLAGAPEVLVGFNIGDDDVGLTLPEGAWRLRLCSALEPEKGGVLPRRSVRVFVAG